MPLISIDVSSAHVQLAALGQSFGVEGAHHDFVGQPPTRDPDLFVSSHFAGMSGRPLAARSLQRVRRSATRSGGVERPRSASPPRPRFRPTPSFSSMGCRRILLADRRDAADGEAGPFAHEVGVGALIASPSVSATFASSTRLTPDATTSTGQLLTWRRGR